MTDQNKYTQKLKGRKVLIIGGTSGIGYCVAEAALESGATVIVASSKQTRVDQTIEKLQAAYPSAKDKISGFVCDLGTEATLEDNVKALLEKAAPLDHIIHTAGDALADLPLEKESLDHIKQAGMVRFFAPLLIGKYAKQYLKQSNESSYTLTTGSTGERPIPGWTVVSSYATGLFGMTKALAIDLAPRRVNIVSPGAVETELWDAMGEEKKRQILDHHTQVLLTRRVPGPEEIAEAYLYLMKDFNVTGATVSTNGGGTLV